MAITHEKVIEHIQLAIKDLSYTRGRASFTMSIVKGYFDDGFISETEFKEYEAQLQQIYQELPENSQTL